MGWTLDRKIRVRFPAYPHRVWAIWWQGGKRRLRTSRCPCRGRLGTLKTPSCPWRGCPAAGQNLETGHLSRHYIAEISLNVTLNHKQTNNKFLTYNNVFVKHCPRQQNCFLEQKSWWISQSNWSWCHLKGHHWLSMHAEYKVSIFHGSKYHRDLAVDICVLVTEAWNVGQGHKPPCTTWHK